MAICYFGIIVCLLGFNHNIKSIGKVDNLEVDFVCKRSKPTCIQVSYLLTSEDTVEREFPAIKEQLVLGI